MQSKIEETFEVGTVVGAVLTCTLFVFILMPIEEKKAIARTCPTVTTTQPTQ